jgi:hypothetical protein
MIFTSSVFAERKIVFLKKIEITNIDIITQTLILSYSNGQIFLKIYSRLID